MNRLNANCSIQMEMLLITLSVWITLGVIQALHIDVVPADSIQFADHIVSNFSNVYNTNAHIIYSV